MVNRKSDIINFLGSTLFIVFFFLLISSFSDKSVKQTINTIQLELVSELHTNSGKAIIADAVQLPPIQKNWVSFLDKSNFKLFSEDLKIFTYNQKIDQRILFLQKNQLEIKPIFLYRFYHLQSLPDIDELPILS